VETWLDGDGYPTDEALQRLRDWPLKDCDGALDFVRELWSDYGTASPTISAHEGYVLHAEPGDRYLRLATGGWSGNEDLIAAMQRNEMAWLMTWRLSARGGLYIFQYQEVG
jgi:hypothetical protein